MSSGSPSQRLYVGLAATLHDPAVALVDSAGKVLFAEALERPLQDKRAFNAAPDHLVQVRRLLEEHCDPSSDVVAAVNWSRGLALRLGLLALDDVPFVRRATAPLTERALRARDPLLWPLPSQLDVLRALRSTIRQAGDALRWHLQDRLTDIRYYDHHLTHAAYACLSSPFETAACAVVDGFGESSSTALYRYGAGHLTRVDRGRPRRPGSLGMFYGSLCGLCGFDPLLGEEWKVMGLAPYGDIDQELYDLMRPLLRVEGLQLVAGCSPREYHRRLDELRSRARAPGADPLEAADMARTGQQVFSELSQELLQALHAETGEKNLVLTGGCALNSSWNGRALERTSFERLYVPPAPADDGTAIGAALWARQSDGNPPASTAASAYLGSSVDPRSLDRLELYSALPVERLGRERPRRLAQLLADGKILGVFCGRAEFGPRALGNRSILADPRSESMKERINEVVKRREPFRPFAPAILHEHGPDYFDPYQDSPFMDRTLRFRESVRRQVPAVVHEDGTGRVQSVHEESNPAFYELLQEFHALTDVPLLLNTSLNVMGKPIAHSLEDVVALLHTTGLDGVVIEDRLLLKEAERR